MSSGNLLSGSPLFQQTFLECLMHARPGHEQGRHGPWLGGAPTLVGQAGLEQKVPTVMNASKTYRVLWEGNRGTQVSVREESGKAPRGRSG